MVETVKLWEWTRAWLETDEVDSRQIRAGVLIMACSSGIGPRLKPLQAHTGIPVDDVNRVSWYLRRAKIWGPGRTSQSDGLRPDWFRARWLEDDCTDMEAVIAFVMQTMTATGDLVSRDGESFRIRTMGDLLGISYEGAPSWRDWVGKARPLRAVGAEPWWLGRAA